MYFAVFTVYLLYEVTHDVVISPSTVSSEKYAALGYNSIGCSLMAAVSKYDT